MDRHLIERKLESLRRAVQRVEAKRPATVESLAGDVDVQDILAVNLTRAVQICVDIGAHLLADSSAPPPDTMGETFDALARSGLISAPLCERMKKAVGFRNIAVHSYQAMDWRIVHTIAHERLEDFREYARAVTAALN